MAAKGVRKILRIVIRILLILLIAVIALLALSTATNQIMTAVEKGKYPAPGVMVDVNGEKMHVYSEGSGDKTIVMLSGLGTGSPVIDFAPLIKELGQSYKVVVVENFGYGWSDVTQKPRTVQNIVEETRLALKEAGFKPPYILMPHSISGIYSLYYANTYPDEIEGVIGIDTSVPAQISLLSPSFGKSPLAALQTFTGLVRIATKIDPSLVMTADQASAYTADQLKLMRLMYCWHSDNKSIINETNHVYVNIQAVQGIKYPDSIPALFFLSQSSADTFGSVGMDWVSVHQELTGNAQSNCIVLEGPHYLHRIYATRMVDEIKQFINPVQP